MKITLIELDLQCSTVIYQSVLTSISDFIFLSEVMTIQQIDGIAHKLNPRLFHKFILASMLWDTLDTNNFYFIFFDFI